MLCTFTSFWVLRNTLMTFLIAFIGPVLKKMEFLIFKLLLDQHLYFSFFVRNFFRTYITPPFRTFLTDQEMLDRENKYGPFFIWGQSYKTFYTLGGCKIKSLNCCLNDKEKCNPANMLGCCVLT